MQTESIFQVLRTKNPLAYADMVEQAVHFVIGTDEYKNSLPSNVTPIARFARGVTAPKWGFKKDGTPRKRPGRRVA